jgi:hypothetical protein
MRSARHACCDSGFCEARYIDPATRRNARVRVWRPSLASRCKAMAGRALYV